MHQLSMKTIRLFQAIFIFACLYMLCSCARESNSPSVNRYFPIVKSIIQNNCLVCHSSGGLWTGRPVAFDSDSAIAASSESIKAAVADPISPVNRRMPQGGSLSAGDIDMIVKWFEKGGKVTD
jgi:uncharacterized membrane protein